MHAAEDIECIHRMRVASRRIRTRLRLFADILPAKRLRAWQQSIRRITRALGEARDLDVQLAFLLDFLDALSEHQARAGIEAVLHALQAHRANRQHQVAQALRQLEQSGTLPDLHNFFTPYYSSEVPYPPALHQMIESTITAQLADLIRYEVYLAFPERGPEHHAMRIAAKHLRYSLETFTPLLGDEIKSTLKIMRELQDCLGDIHDCDVWDALLTDEQLRRLLLPQGDAIPEAWHPGVELLRRDRRTFREARFTKLVALWQEQQQQLRWYHFLQGVRECR